MTFGPHARWLAEVAQEAGDEIPADAIPPELPIGFAFAYAAFRALISDREMGFGIGQIRFTTIDAYARRYGIIALDEFDELVADIGMIDGLYLELSKPPDK